MAYVDLVDVAVTTLGVQAIAVAAQAQTLLALPQLDQVVFTVSGRPWMALTDAKREAAARQEALRCYVYSDYLAPVAGGIDQPGFLFGTPGADSIEVGLAQTPGRAREDEVPMRTSYITRGDPKPGALAPEYTVRRGIPRLDETLFERLIFF